MKSLYIFLEEIMATPGNTMGMGNPGVDTTGEVMTEPIGTNIDKKKRPKRSLVKKNIKV